MVMHAYLPDSRNHEIYSDQPAFCEKIKY